MRCPRCRRDTKDGTQFCPACGAPLALGPEPTPHAIDLPVTLDRRGPARPADPADPADPTALQPLRTGSLEKSAHDVDEDDPGFDLERSVDDLDAAEIVGHRLPPPPRADGRTAAASRAAAPDREARLAATRDEQAAAVPLHQTLKPAPPQRPLEPPPPDAERSHYDLGKLPAPGNSEPAWAAGAPPAARAPGPPAGRPPATGPARPGSQAAAPAPVSPRPAAPLDPDEGGTVEVVIAPMEVHLRRAATWRRVLSWVIDGVPFLALFALALRAALALLPGALPADVAGLGEQALAEAAGVTLPLLGGVAILFAVYHALAHGLAGATLGKRLVGVRLVGPGGRKPGLGRAAARALLLGPSVALLGLGLVLALFTRSGRALHDFLARTWVVRAP